MKYGRGMLDYVQSTCSHVKATDYASVPASNHSVQQLFPDARNIDGEYIPDPEQVAAWEEEAGVRPQYGNELRYVNCGPTKIRNLLETETDPRERQALEQAYKAWQGIAPMQHDPASMGWVHRGEPREANHTTLQEMAANVDPVPYEYDMGKLSAKGSGSRSVPGPNGELDMGLFEELELDRSAEDLYFEAGGFVPPVDGQNDIDMMLDYDVEEFVNY